MGRGGRNTWEILLSLLPSFQGFRRRPSERPSRSHCVSWVSFSSFRFAKKKEAQQRKEAWTSWLPGQPACPFWDTVFAYRARVCDLCELPACVRACVRAHLRLLVLLFFSFFAPKTGPSPLSFFQICTDCRPRQQHGGTHAGETSADGVADVLGLQRESLDLSMSTRIFEVFVLLDRVIVGLPGAPGVSTYLCVCVPEHAGGQVPKV